MNIENQATILLKREKGILKASVVFLQEEWSILSNKLDDLHPEENKVLQSYTHIRRKLSYVLGRIAAKKAIQQLSDYPFLQHIWIDNGVFLFPIVRCAALENIQVSISHCDNIGVSIAFPESHPMGIDIEKMEISRLEVFSSQLTALEKLLLIEKTKNDIHGFTSLFGIKEALSKVIKTGMMIDFKLLEIDRLEILEHTLMASFKHFSQYKGFAFTSGQYVVSVVLPRKTDVDLGVLQQFFEK